MGESASWNMEGCRVVILGSGNVATHLAKAIDEHHHVVQIYSRKQAHASALAQSLKDCTSTDNLDHLITDADIYIISVSDDSIGNVVDKLPRIKGIVVHTSGSVGMDVLSTLTNPTGVFYPLQTFSKDTAVNLSEVPFFLEASTPETLDKLEAFGSFFSKKIFHANSEQRQTLHIAAVFACNFFNHLLDISTEILSQKGYELDVLKPLVALTMSKAFETGAYASQTGPAVRGDMATLNKHIESLDTPQKEIYRMLSQSIIDRHNIKKEYEQN